MLHGHGGIGWDMKCCNMPKQSETMVGLFLFLFLLLLLLLFLLFVLELLHSLLTQIPTLQADPHAFTETLGLTRKTMQPSGRPSKYWHRSHCRPIGARGNLPPGGALGTWPHLGRCPARPNKECLGRA